MCEENKELKPAMMIPVNDILLNKLKWGGLHINYLIQPPDTWQQFDLRRFLGIVES